MKKLILTLAILFFSMGFVSATEWAWGGYGWLPCNPEGNYYYGGWGPEHAFTCYVAWNQNGGECPDSTRDADFIVGLEGQITTQITISHLDSIAETGDSYQILDEEENVLCEWTDPVFGNNGIDESWVESSCDVALEGIHTLTLHPTADHGWCGTTPGCNCGVYGQLAIRSIGFESYEPQVPEFGILAGFFGAIGGIIGIILIRKK